MEFLFKMKEMAINTLDKANYFATVRQYVTEAQSFLVANEKADCDAKLSKLLDYVDNLENVMEVLALLQTKTVNKINHTKQQDHAKNGL